MRQLLLALATVLLGALLIFGGCASQPSRFYVLSASSSVDTPLPLTSGQQGPTIGVGPVTLPRYLDRPQIVTRSSPYELRLAEFDRWAEALDVNFSRVLADNLALLMPTARVVPLPGPRAIPIDYQVSVDASQFLSQMGGESLLIADWTLFRGEGPAVLANRTSRFSVPAGGPDYAAIVAAMSQTVAGLSREIAEAISRLGERTSAR
jgi:uncharacterized protein